MFNLRKVIFALLISTILTFVIGAQPPVATTKKGASSADNTKVSQNFASIEGGFSLSLPEQISSFRRVEPLEGKTKGGMQFFWQIPQGFYTAGYVDLYLPEEGKNVIETTSADVIKQTISDGGKLISKKEISFEGNPGLEVIMSLKNAVIVIGRHYVVDKRIYTITSGWREGDDGTKQLKILDSFKLINGKAIIAKKIDEATPKPLPQSPIVKKLSSDAQDDELKGKVKSVSETEEDLTGTWSVSGIKMSSEDFYDENGNKIKRILYDYKGNPMDITIYGYIDGMRVSNYGSVNYEYNPPIMAISSTNTKPNPVQKPSDTRYNTKYEYKYDDKGRLQETVRYRNNGEITGKIVYSYNGNKIEESSFDNDGKLTFKTVKVFDNKSNLIEKTYSRPNNSSDSNYTYKYESFDEKGNWTKRVVSGIESNGKKQNYIEYRAITYYR